MSKSQKREALEEKIKQLARSNGDSAIGNLKALSSQIKKFDGTKAERDKLFERLEIAFSLFYNLKGKTLPPQEKQGLLLDFFEEFADIRHNHHNVLTPNRATQLSNLVSQVDISQLTSDEMRDFAKNLDLIGFDRTSAFATKELANAFLEKGLAGLLSNPYRGTKWIKNAAHFLVHCKNLGLIGADNSEQTKAAVVDIVKNIAKFITQHNENLNFSESDAQASLDLLLYGKHVLGLQFDEHAEPIIAALNLKLAKKTSASKTQSEIFQRIVRFLENRKGDEYEWRQAEHSRKELQDEYIFGGVVAVSIEKPFLDIDGIPEKNADIVVRNLVTGEIILVIEIDGPTHFLCDGIKSGKTKARDELARAILGERLVVIDMKSFNLFKGLKQKTKDDQADQSYEELEFLRRIQSVIQDELEKIAAAPKPKRTTSASPSSKSKKVAVAEPLKATVTTEASAAKPKPIAKTAAEIKAELLSLFWEALKQNPVSDSSVETVEEILSDHLFASISRQEIKDPESALNPFDLAIVKFNSASSKKEKYHLETLLKLLWVNGFEHQNKAVVSEAVTYPDGLNFALGRTAETIKTCDLNAVLRNARRNNFSLVKIALERDGLPPELDEKAREAVIKLTKIAITQQQKGYDFLINFLQHQPWFREVEEEVFVQALENSDDAIAQFFLKEKKIKDPNFFIRIFRSNEHLLSKIYDFELYSTTDELEAEIKKDEALSEKSVKQIAKSSEPRHARDLYQLARILYNSSDKSTEALIFKAEGYFYGLGHAQDFKKAEKFLNQALANEGNEEKAIHDALLLLGDVYQHSKRPQEAEKIFRDLAKKGSGEAYYYLSVMVKYVGKTEQQYFTMEERIHFLEKAAALEHPKALGLIASQHLQGIVGKKQNHALAIRMLNRAIALGDVESITNLGTTYSHCLHEIPDEESLRLAFDLYRKATSKRSSSGALNLAMCYDEGNGTAKDPVQALKFYKLSQEFGLSDEHFVSFSEERITALESELKKGGIRFRGATQQVATIATVSKSK